MSESTNREDKRRVSPKVILAAIIIPYGVAMLAVVPFLILGVLDFDNARFIAVPAQLVGVLLVAKIYRWNRKDLGLVIND